MFFNCDIIILKGLITMITFISNEVVESINNEINNLLSEPENKYIKDHILNVKNYSVLLANYRNLDVNIAQLIALFHSDKKIFSHKNSEISKVSGYEVAEELLNKHFVDYEVKSIIKKAISNHDKKMVIQDKYSELLKDADSIELKEKLKIVTSKYELYREMDAYLPSFSIRINQSKDINKVLKKNLKKLNNYIDNGMNNGFSDKKIHKIRVRIRKIRALLWIDKQEKWGKKSKKLNKALKDIFKVFKYPREIAVLKKLLIKIEENPCILNRLDSEIKESKKDIKEKMKLSKKKIDEFKIPKLDVKNENIKDCLNTYYDMLKYSYENIDDLKRLHNLRIYQKKIKYLVEDDILILFDSDDYDLVEKIHSLIGELNDISDNKKLLTKFFNINKKKSILQKEKYYIYFDKNEKLLKQDIKAKIFRILNRNHGFY